MNIRHEALICFELEGACFDDPGCRGTSDGKVTGRAIKYIQIRTPHCFCGVVCSDFPSIRRTSTSKWVLIARSGILGTSLYLLIIHVTKFSLQQGMKNAWSRSGNEEYGWVNQEDRSVNII